jgi:adenylosuccinate lyase
LDVELAITEVWHEWGEVPDKSLKNLKKNACFNVKRINEIEKKVKHDVIAFLTSIEESVGADSAYLHKGITSYDVVDTALSLLIRESLDIVIKSAEEFRKILLKKAYKYKDTVTIGRTHGIHAEPITFGIKYLIWSEEMRRNIRRLKQAKETISVGKISGSVGTYIHFPPEGEEKALQKLKLKPCRVSSQIIQRDRHAEVLFALSILGTTLEKIAVEIRHLQRTEVLEVEEPFTTGQKGSSSMPHKRNPVRCERVSGMARLLRSHLTAGLEDNILWHERDISHSSVERVIFPDAFHTAAFMLKEMKEVIKNLNVYPESMKINLDITNEVYYSQKVLTLLVDKAIPRQKAYELVQKKALESWEKRMSFRKLVLSDQEILNVCSKTELEGIFSEKKLMDGIKKIFERFKGG